MGLAWSQGQIDAANALTGPARHACLFGGARSGKTFLTVRMIFMRAIKAPGSRHVALRYRFNAVWGALAGDANSTIGTVNKLCFPDLKLNEHKKDGYYDFPNGSTFWLGGLEDKERLDKILGREYSTIYLNEASEIPYASAAIAFTRLAEVKPEIKQRIFVDLNPVGKSHWTNRMFVEGRDPITLQPLARPEDYACARLNPQDNIHNLTPEFLESLASLPEKQRKRFFEGVFVDEVEGALWTYENIERNRLAEKPEDIMFRRVVVGVDPSGAANKDSGGDEIGIVVAALGSDGHGYVLADRSIKCGPREWASVAVQAYREFKADRIVAETNFGGAMVEETIKAVDRNVPVSVIHASRGKVLRAEPISALYEQNKVHHVGRFGKLEDQFCAFSSTGYMGGDSPDHADAAVHALSDLILGNVGPLIVQELRL